MAQDGINRRRLLQSIGATGSVGLAGCSGMMGGDDDTGNGNGGNGGGSGSDELGERVPTVEIHYPPDVALSSTFESILPLATAKMEELGLSTNITPSEFTTLLSDVTNDAQNHDYTKLWYNTIPERLNPYGGMEVHLPDNAGARGGLGISQWADCEAADAWYQSAFATSEEEEQEQWATFFGRMAEDRRHIAFADRKMMGAHNTDMTVNRIGRTGPTLFNHNFFVHSEPPSGRDELVVGVPQLVVDVANFTTIDDTEVVAPWNLLVHTGLLAWNEEWELEPAYAESFEATDNNTHFHFELREGTFHNGDPVTAEDVAWTYEFLMDTADLSGDRTTTNIETEVIDDSTLEITTDIPSRIFLTETCHRWGILHRESWIDAGAEDNPAEVTYDPETMPGSGPFQIASRSRGSEMVLEPHDGHPLYEPDHDLIFQVFNDDQGMLNAIEGGEIDIAPGVSFEGYRFARDEIDNAEAVAVDGFAPFLFNPQTSTAPTKFWEFRDAVGKSIDRQEINQLVFDGEAREPTEPTYLLTNHPLVPDDVERYTDDPSGDVEAAREVLSENGWGWDDDGNLHYPPDADLDPVWPQGEGPDPSEFDCLDSDGEYVPPEDR